MSNATDGFPQVAASSLPHLTTQQMIEVDRATIEDYGIELLQMMENAGRGLTGPMLLLTAYAEQASAETTSIVVILTDDAGWNSLSIRSDPEIPESGITYYQIERKEIKNE